MSAEHPDLCVSDRHGRCGVCGDEGVEAVVLARAPGADTARVRMEGDEREVDVALVPEAAPGDRLVVHLGFAIGRVEEPEHGSGPHPADRPGTGAGDRTGAAK